MYAVHFTFFFSSPLSLLLNLISWYFFLIQTHLKLVFVNFMPKAVLDILYYFPIPCLHYSQKTVLKSIDLLYMFTGKIKTEIHSVTLFHPVFLLPGEKLGFTIDLGETFDKYFSSLNLKTLLYR